MKVEETVGALDLALALASKTGQDTFDACLVEAGQSAMPFSSMGSCRRTQNSNGVNGKLQGRAQKGLGGR
jgi:hypothetical protein